MAPRPFPDRDRLTALEAAFLHIESQTTPMHMGSLATFDAVGWRDGDERLRLDALKAHIDARLNTLPRLRQRVRWPAGSLSRPRWVTDEDFDIDRHVRYLRLPAPGGWSEVLAAVEATHMVPLDRRHPLWELWFVDGLEDGQAAIIEKIHHALVDGIGGVDVAMMLLDPDRQSPPPGPPPEPPPTRRWLVRSMPWALRHPLGAVERAVDLATAVVTVSRPAGGGGPLAPGTSLNEPIDVQRRYRVLRRSLEEAKTTAHRLGGTVNDLLLTAVATGMHELLIARGEDLDVLRVLVPVSTRASDEHADLGNRVTAMVVPLPTGQATAEDRFRAVREAVRRTKDAHEPELTETVLQAAEPWPELLTSAVSGLVHHQRLVNLVVTNVPGPPTPLYLMGSRMVSLYPIVPLARNLTVSIGIISYAGELALGLWADRKRFPDLDLLVSRIGEALDELDALRPGEEEGHGRTTPSRRLERT